jgi:hypothetical protein
VNEETQTPKAFISYSWTSEEHKNRVRELVDRLIGDGVETLLDQYDLKEGDDTFAYMEKMVTDPSVSKVVVICNRTYKEKSDGRKGGVGHESTIISPEVYKQVSGNGKDNKFVAVIFEKDENGQAYTPAMFASKLYIDMSTDESYNANYEQLLRFLFNKPVLKKPELGKPPSFILEDTRPSMVTTGKVASIKDAINRDRIPFARGLLGDYFDVLIGVLENMPPGAKDGNLADDEVAIKEIQNFKPYRNELVELTNYLFKFTNPDELEIVEQYGSFLEKGVNVVEKLSQKLNLKEIAFDHISYLLYEIFLYITSIFYKNKRINELIQILERKYYVQRRLRASYTGYSDFYPELDLFEKVRQSRLNTKYISYKAHLLQELADNKIVLWVDLCLMDFLLWLRYSITKSNYWHPSTRIYWRYSGSFEAFNRAESIQEVTPLLQIVGAKDIEHFKKWVIDYQASDNGQRWDFEYDISLPALVNFDRLGKQP